MAFELHSRSLVLRVRSLNLGPQELIASLHHSNRSAAKGSTFDARRAGM